ncbi:MAG: DUF3999 domain-containing protein [Chromatiaceae bacterium]
MKPPFALLLLALFFTPVLADTSKPLDFAYGLRLATPEAAPIYRLALPLDVYRRTTRPDLGDLRVFNAAGEPVPSALRRPAHAAATAPAPQTLPFFPFERVSPEGGGRVSVKVVTNDRGAVVNVGNAGTTSDKVRTASYLVDLSAIQPGRINALTLEWTGPELVHLAVAASDDLNRWRPLVKDASLLRLEYAGHRLEKRRVSLPAAAYRYLRLSLPPEEPPVGLTSVEASFASVAPESKRNWLRLAGKPAADGKDAWTFDTGGPIPVDLVELELPQSNSLVGVRLLSRDDDKQRWLARGRAVLYRLEVEGTRLTSRSISVHRITDRHWRLEIQSDPAGLGPDPPTLAFGWRPRELYFLARGPGPFLLAYGRGGTASSPAPIDALFRDIRDGAKEGLVGPAVGTEKVVLGGEMRLKAPPAAIAWRTLLLWAVLVLGVALLGWMAWGMVRQMRTVDNRDR